MDKTITVRGRVSLTPDEMLPQIVSGMLGSGKVKGLQTDYPRWTTWTTALKRCADAIVHNDGALLLDKPKTPAHRLHMQKLAKEAMDLEPFQQSANQPLGLRIRNMGDPNLLPPPPRASMTARLKLKENFMSSPPDSKEPYVSTIRALREDRKLAVLAGVLRLNAIDSISSHPDFTITSTEMLFDTGAHVSLITEDLLTQEFRDFVRKDSVHDPYRTSDGSGVQVDAIFSFLEGSVSMSCLFHVVPRSKVPNGRSGIILGQHTLIDRMVYMAVPRAILVHDGEKVEENVWGDILIHRYVGTEGEMVSV